MEPSGSVHDAPPAGGKLTPPKAAINLQNFFALPRIVEPTIIRSPPRFCSIPRAYS